MYQSSRGWGKSKLVREAFEAAKANGEHAHHWSSSGTECSIGCGKESSPKG